MTFQGYISPDEMKAIQAEQEAAKIDQTWATNIATVPLGAGWKMARPEEENQRNFKRRINAAAAVSGRELDWTPQETNLPPNTEPTNYLIRVKSIKKLQQPQNGTVQTQQTTDTVPSTSESSENGEEAQRRRRG